MDVTRALLGCLIAIAVWPLGCQGVPLALSLKRAFPLSLQGDMRHLVDRDSMRHKMTLQSSSSSRSVVSYRLNGSVNIGLYMARIRLGSPPRDLDVQIDTGSDILWVSCSSELPTVSRNIFDPNKSSTSTPVNCSDQMCLIGRKSKDTFCSMEDQTCNYNITYVDGSSSAGPYLSDLLHFGEKLNDTAPVVFGCSDYAVDPSSTYYSGILGLGNDALSISSQLASQRIAPKAFSHCLSGDKEGGGTLVFGAVRHPNVVYTPMVRHGSNYHVSMEGIYVNGGRAPIDFATSGNSGTVLDSGTTLAYLADQVYDPFVQAVAASISAPASPFFSGDVQCYSTSPSVNSSFFPQVRFDFEGGASMLLTPDDYLRLGDLTDEYATWCLQFWRADKFAGNRLTILGDVILKNKLVVYDLGAHRIGWAKYNCSIPLNMSMVDTGDQHRVAPSWTLLSCIMVLFVWLL